MLGDIAAGQRDAEIVNNTDRLTRRPIELEQFTGIREVAGVRQLVAVTGDIDLGNEDGTLSARVLAAVAAKKSRRKSERLKWKAREGAEAGKPNAGIRPFGYDKSQRTIVGPEAAVIRQRAERYLAGESMGSLRRWIQDQEILTVTGIAWLTSTERSIPANPRIAGLRAHNGEIVGVRRGRRSSHRRSTGNWSPPSVGKHLLVGVRHAVTCSRACFAAQTAAGSCSALRAGRVAATSAKQAPNTAAAAESPSSPHRLRRRLPRVPASFGHPNLALGSPCLASELCCLFKSIAWLRRAATTSSRRGRRSSN